MDEHRNSEEKDSTPDHTNSVKPEVIKWFRKAYPAEYHYCNQITDNVNKIFSQVGAASNVPIDIVALNTAQGRLSLGMRDVTMLFIGSMVKTIMELIAENMTAKPGPKFIDQLERTTRKAIKEYAEEKFPIIIPEMKACVNCNTMNDNNAVYCKKCGQKF